MQALVGKMASKSQPTYLDIQFQKPPAQTRRHLPFSLFNSTAFSIGTAISAYQYGCEIAEILTLCGISWSAAYCGATVVYAARSRSDFDIQSQVPHYASKRPKIMKGSRPR